MPESCIVKAMRNQNLHHHHYHHQLILLMSLATLKSSLIFNALILMNGQALAKDDDVCNASWLSPTCRPMFTNRTSFPFVSSPECGNVASSFFISGCTDDEKRTWPKFVDACTTSNILLLGNHDITLGPPSVTGFSDQFLLNLSTYTTSTSAFGILNLTWSNPTQLNINKNACKSPAPLSQIAHYLPQSINLTSFARSAFQFTPSNIILLFNCTSLSPVPHNLHKNSPACSSYENGCDLLSKNKSNCYQYIPETKQLNLTQAMESLKCENAMFFVAQQLSIPVSQWKPGLIELNWSTTNNPWMASNLKSCVGCLQTNGSCGYNRDDNFLCYCSNNRNSVTNCSANNISEGLDSTARAPDKGCNNGLWCSIGAKIAIGVVLVLVIVVFSLVILYYYHKKRRGFLTKIVPFKLAKRSTRQKSFGSSSLIISHLHLDRLTERTIEFQYASIVSATKSFSSLLGEGGFGAVYKGTLGDAKGDVHMHIAVKVLEVRSKHSKKQFLNEVTAIGRIHHVYVVRLLGFCIEENHEMLVYEYVINGSLDRWLFHDSSSQKQVLPWEQRYTIALGIAKGLSYLHDECRHRIVHCDIKPQNILLDEHMCPKIADFGLARLMGREESRVVTLARGTPGYMAPEFWMGGESQLSTKFDVYSYGMVLLELISGQQNFGNGKCFPETAFEAAMGGNFKSIMDVKMIIGKTVDEFDVMQRQRQVQVRTAVLVALWCIQDHPVNRPSMSEVVHYLEGISAINEQPPRPTIASTIAISPQQRHAYLSNDLHYDNITPISRGR